MPTAPASQSSIVKVQFSAIPDASGFREMLYGTGGIGKSTLACLAEGATVFYDFEKSLPRLKPQLIEMGIKVPQEVPCPDWATLRATLQGSGWDSIKNIVLDTGTMMEQLATRHALKTIKHEKTNQLVTSVEGYGWGKGYQYVFETFIGVLQDLDNHAAKGRNVFIICHECTSTVPNPRGQDWMRYEPRLQLDKGSGKTSIRAKVKEWADHVLFLGYDVAVDEDTKKAEGSGTRTLYTQERPFCMAKSRTACPSEIVIEKGVSPWPTIFCTAQ